MGKKKNRDRPLPKDGKAEQGNIRDRSQGGTRDLAVEGQEEVPAVAAPADSKPEVVAVSVTSEDVSSKVQPGSTKQEDSRDSNALESGLKVEDQDEVPRESSVLSLPGFYTHSLSGDDLHLRAQAGDQVQQNLTEETPLTKERDSGVAVDDVLLDEKLALKSDEAVVPVRTCNFYQSLFNVVNVTMGLGIMSIPYAMLCSGWVIGLFFIMAYGAVAVYTALLIGRVLSQDNKLLSYPDMGTAAFGLKGKVIITIIMSAELFALSVAFLIVCSENLNALFPNVMNVRIWRIIAFAAVLPTVWLTSMRALSYCSLVGVTSVLFLSFVVIFQGAYRSSPPGSIGHPMPTYAGPIAWMAFPLSSGIIMSAMTAHAVYPSIYREMRDPKQYSKTIIIGFSLVLTVYFLVAICGYLMFGPRTLEIITKNLMQKGFIVALNYVALALIILNPLCKYAIELNPIGLLIEEKFIKKRFHGWKFNVYRILMRTILAAASFGISQAIDQFRVVLGFTGSFFSFSGSIIFPCLCYMKLSKKKINLFEKILLIFIIVFSVIAMIVGTVWVALPASITHAPNSNISNASQFPEYVATSYQTVRSYF